MLIRRNRIRIWIQNFCEKRLGSGSATYGCGFGSSTLFFKHFLVFCTLFCIQTLRDLLLYISFFSVKVSVEDKRRDEMVAYSDLVDNLPDSLAMNFLTAFKACNLSFAPHPTPHRSVFFIFINIFGTVFLFICGDM
jgi:hypothetical protein